MILVGIFAFRQEAQTSQQNQDDPPTPIQLGVMSEKQRRNSKLFEVPPNQGRKNLLSSLKKSPRGFTVLYPGDTNLGINPQYFPSQTEFLQKNTCQANIILIGTISEKSSQITADLKTIFTDYEVSIKSIISNKSNLNIESPVVTVTKIGGSILINNSKINYIVKSQKQLKVGMTYLLFLSYLPESNSFKPANSESVFAVTGNRIIRYNDTVPPYKNINEDINFVINVIRESTVTCLAKGEN
jgi:hypothetical protein